MKAGGAWSAAANGGVAAAAVEKVEELQTQLAQSRAENSRVRSDLKDLEHEHRSVQVQIQQIRIEHRNVEQALRVQLEIVHRNTSRLAEASVKAPREPSTGRWGRGGEETGVGRKESYTTSDRVGTGHGAYKASGKQLPDLWLACRIRKNIFKRNGRRFLKRERYTNPGEMKLSYHRARSSVSARNSKG